MGDYRTPDGERWTPWVGLLLALGMLGSILMMVPAKPVAGLIGWLLALAGFVAYLTIRTWSTWHRQPTLIRLSKSQLTARRGDGSVIAEIPHSAIASIRDDPWSDRIVVRGTDGISKIEIPLATKGIRELLIALADLLPPYLWDLETARRFAVPFPWMLTLAIGISTLSMAVCFYLADWTWLAVVAVIGGVGLLASTHMAVRHFEISRAGVTIRRYVGSRFVPSSEVSAVQLKLGMGEVRMLYVSLLLESGKRVGLMNAEQSAVVVYRALLGMQKRAG